MQENRQNNGRRTGDNDDLNMINNPYTSSLVHIILMVLNIIILPYVDNVISVSFILIITIVLVVYSVIYLFDFINVIQGKGIIDNEKTPIKRFRAIIMIIAIVTFFYFLVEGIDKLQLNSAYEKDYDKNHNELVLRKAAEYKVTDKE